MTIDSILRSAPRRATRKKRKKKEGAAAAAAAAVWAIARADYSERGRTFIGRVQSSGQVCFIHLLGRGVTPAQFTLPVLLECMPTDEGTVFKYARAAA
jgi:hypothetical protein